MELQLGFYFLIFYLEVLTTRNFLEVKISVYKIFFLCVSFFSQPGWDGIERHACLKIHIYLCLPEKWHNINLFICVEEENLWNSNFSKRWSSQCELNWHCAQRVSFRKNPISKFTSVHFFSLIQITHPVTNRIIFRPSSTLKHTNIQSKETVMFAHKITYFKNDEGRRNGIRTQGKRG